MKRSVTVHVAGQRLSLRADTPTGEDEVHTLAAEVDARIRDIQRQTRAADSYQVALLAALQLAEELRAAKAAHATEKRAAAESRKALADLRRRVREKSESLLHFLERRARV